MPKQSYVWLKTDGSHGQVDLGQLLTLEEMQGLVGGYIERISVRYEGKLRDMWVNEEGLLDSLPQNHEASRIARRLIVGDVFIIL
ncbi:hypothetical protein LCGC14_1736140 [marine sediment metagenome]|uniref:DUF3846 domain-containing protein n=1 Tax=marine sediment metagenome TaxID=412755 RepID=A0A0F9K7Q5_9ZZZZ